MKEEKLAQIERGFEEERNDLKVLFEGSKGSARHSNEPGFPILSLPLGAPNDVIARTISLHSVPSDAISCLASHVLAIGLQ